MSKRTKKCPDCGSQMSQNAVRCNRCGYRVPSSQSERVDSLPRPIRPEAPRPVETSRWPENPSEYEQTAAERKTAPRNMGQLIAVLAVIAAILIVAIVLVVKISKPANETENESGNVSNTVFIDENGNMVVGTQPPAGESITVLPEMTPDVTDAPEATEAPEATDAPEAEPEATPEATAEPDVPQDPSITVSEKDDTIYITGNSVNLREGPGTEYDRITSAERGDEYKRTGVTDNGWSRVTYKGEDAYVANSYVSTEKPDPIISDASGTVVTTGDANLRKGPGTENDVAVTVETGTELERTGTSDNGWTRVQYDGQELYISNTLVQEKVTVAEKDGTVVLTADANLRKGPGTGYDVIATLKTGTELERTGETGSSWVRVKYNDQDAYVHSSLLELKDDSGNNDSAAEENQTEEADGTVTVLQGANVRSGPGTEYDKLGLAYVGTELKVTGKSGDWYEVEFDGQKGYIASSLVKEN